MFSRILVAASAFAAFAFGAAAPAMAQQAQVPAGWFKSCTKQADNDICNVQNIRTAANGQLLTAINLIQVSGTVNRQLFQVAVPTGRVIPAGVSMRIDGGQPQKIDYAICLADRCIAEAPLTDALVASMKRGGEVVLTTLNFQQQPNPITFTLSGFTAAYDGDPLQQSELEERQQQLQAEIQKRREEFQQRLREEQERAKEGG
ncbi:MAG: invasion associated locus B family protein [Pseudomonadota bacterium]